MHNLSNTELLEAYELAKKIATNKEFIKQLEEEIKRRGL
ncbi:sporulation histidine kinase inhibitor Sda [Sporosarcina sp. GW1-11]|nr:sporulation histidine kinase inhibitor Sda [Sporosarcina sp. GW1-11]